MKSFVLNDEKEEKMSVSSLKLRRQVITSAPYSQRLLERFGNRKPTSATECIIISFYLLGNIQYFHFPSLQIVPGKPVNLTLLNK